MERFLAGEWDDALVDLEEALTLTEETGERYSLVLSHAVKALIALHRGELRQAEASVATAERELAATGSRFRSHWASWARALVLEAQGETEQALTTLTRSWELCARLGFAVEFPVLGPDLVRQARGRHPPAAAGPGRLRAPGRHPRGRPGPGRPTPAGRAPGPPRPPPTPPARLAQPHPNRAPSGRPRRRGPVQPPDRPAPVRVPPHRPDPPRPRLHQARHLLTRPTRRRGDPAARGAPTLPRRLMAAPAATPSTGGCLPRLVRGG